MPFISSKHYSGILDKALIIKDDPRWADILDLEQELDDLMSEENGESSKGRRKKTEKDEIKIDIKSKSIKK
jgi:hypothetical protein